MLMRSGHTEACVDLCRLAGLPPVGVLSELVNDDGTVMRGPQVAAFAEKHKLDADLGRRPDRLPAGAREAGRARRRVSRSTSEIGTLNGYAYVTPFDTVHHMAFVYGDIGDGKDVPARLHRADVIGDVFGGAKPIHAALHALQGGRAAASSSICATAPPACRSHDNPAGRRHRHGGRAHRGNGARSASARRS